MIAFILLTHRHAKSWKLLPADFPAYWDNKPILKWIGIIEYDKLNCLLPEQYLYIDDILIHVYKFS
jgi:hypothetical protein